MLENIADINIKDNNNRSSVELAVGFNSNQVVELILKNMKRNKLKGIS